MTIRQIEDLQRREESLRDMLSMRTRFIYGDGALAAGNFLLAMLSIRDGRPLHITMISVLFTLWFTKQMITGYGAIRELKVLIEWNQAIIEGRKERR